jgi:hypothetical protein
MLTINTTFYSEPSTFTAESWEQEEVAYMRNSDEAYIFYGSDAQKDAVEAFLSDHFDSMFLVNDDRIFTFFTNTPLTNEQLLEIEDAGIAFDRFEKSNYGIYELIDTEAE